MGKFTGTKLRTLPGEMMVFTNNASQAMTGWIALFTEARVKLGGNYNKAPSSEHAKRLKFFLIDENDSDFLGELHKECNTLAERQKVSMDFIKSLTDCVAKYPKKRIYLRLLPSARTCPNEESRVFCDDVLEIVPLVMKQQGTPIGGLKDKLEKYRKKWNCEQGIRKTIELGKFESILEEFDCNKDLITIVKDPSRISTEKVNLKWCDGITSISWDSTTTQDVSQACRFAFMALVKGVNWKTDKCRQHEYCLGHMRSKILTLLQQFINFGPGAYFTQAYLVECITKVKDECKYTHYTSQLCPDYMFRERDAMDSIDIHHVLEAIRVYELPVFKEFIYGKRKSRVDEIKVWKARCLLELGWIQNFFIANKNGGVRDVLLNALLFEVPETKRKEMQTFFDKALGIKKPAPAASASTTSTAANVTTTSASNTSDASTTLSGSSITASTSTKPPKATVSTQVTPNTTQVPASKTPVSFSTISGTFGAVSTTLLSSKTHAAPSNVVKQSLATVSAPVASGTTPAPVAKSLTATTNTCGASTASHTAVTSSKALTAPPKDIQAPKATIPTQFVLKTTPDTAAKPPVASNETSGTSDPTSTTVASSKLPTAPFNDVKTPKTAVISETAPAQAGDVSTGVLAEKTTPANGLETSKPLGVPSNDVKPAKENTPPEASTRPSEADSTKVTSLDALAKASRVPPSAPESLEIVPGLASKASVNLSGLFEAFVKKSTSSNAQEASAEPPKLIWNAPEASDGSNLFSYSKNPSKSTLTPTKVPSESPKISNSPIIPIPNFATLSLNKGNEDVAQLKSQIANYKETEQQLKDENQRLSQELSRLKCLPEPKPDEELLKKLAELEEQVKKLHGQNQKLETKVQRQEGTIDELIDRIQKTRQD